MVQRTSGNGLTGLAPSGRGNSDGREGDNNEAGSDYSQDDSSWVNGAQEVARGSHSLDRNGREQHSGRERPEQQWREAGATTGSSDDCDDTRGGSTDDARAYKGSSRTVTGGAHQGRQGGDDDERWMVENFLRHKFFTATLGEHTRPLLQILAGRMRTSAFQRMNWGRWGNRGRNRTSINSAERLRDPAWVALVEAVTQNRTFRRVLRRLGLSTVNLHDVGGDFVGEWAPDTDADGNILAACATHSDTAFQGVSYVLRIILEQIEPGQAPMRVLGEGGFQLFTGQPGRMLFRDTQQPYGGSANLTGRDRPLLAVRWTHRDGDQEWGLLGQAIRDSLRGRAAYSWIDGETAASGGQLTRRSRQTFDSLTSGSSTQRGEVQRMDARFDYDMSDTAP